MCTKRIARLTHKQRGQRQQACCGSFSFLSKRERVDELSFKGLSYFRRHWMERKQPAVPVAKSLTLTSKALEALGPLVDLDKAAETLAVEKVAKSIEILYLFCMRESLLDSLLVQKPFLRVILFREHSHITTLCTLNEY